MHEPFPPISSLPQVPGKPRSKPAFMRIHGRKFSAGVIVLVSALFAALWAMTQQNPGKEDAAYWNDMAQAYQEQDRMPEVFEAYEKAIATDPKDWVAFYSLGNVLLLSRKEAGKYYGLNEQELFDRAFELYEQALILVPDSYPLAADVAQSYYLVQPRRPAAALHAWKRALDRARTEEEQAEARLHLARTQINTGLLDAARENMAHIKDPAHAEAKERLLRRLRGDLPQQTESESQVGGNRGRACIEPRRAPPVSAGSELRLSERKTS